MLVEILLSILHWESSKLFVKPAANWIPIPLGVVKRGTKVTLFKPVVSLQKAWGQLIKQLTNVLFAYNCALVCLASSYN